MADEHEHDYKLKMGVEDDGEWPYDLHVYAECECGAELDQQEIEEIINAKR
jgi:hypothetical protein